MCKLAKCIAVVFFMATEMNAGSGKIYLYAAWKTAMLLASVDDSFGHGCLIDDAAIKHTSSDAVIWTNGH